MHWLQFMNRSKIIFSRFLKIIAIFYSQSSEESRTQGGVPYSQIFKSTAVKRNLRCLLAYHYNRLRSLRTMRWEFGSILPAEVKANMSAAENVWFSKYSSHLAKYMRSIGENGMNLAMDLKPPKTTFIEVRCLVDYGKYELSDGTVLLLKKNSQHYLPRVECEELIRQGVFHHIVH